MRLKVLVISFFILTVPLKGQDYFMSDTIKALSLLEHADRILLSKGVTESYDSSKVLLEQAFLISKELGYKKGIVLYHIYNGLYYSQRKGNKVKALTNFKIALSISDSIGDSILIMRSNVQLAILYLKMCDSAGLDIVKQCETIALSLEKHDILSELYLRLAMYYHCLANDGKNSRNNFDTSMIYHKKTFNEINKLQGKEKARKLVIHYSCLSLIHVSDKYYKQNLLKAIDILKKGKDVIKKYDLKESVPVNINLGNSYEELYNRNNSALHYLDSALLYYKLGEKIANVIENAYFKGVAYSSIADVLYLKGETTQAIDYSNKYYKQRNINDSLKQSDNFAKFKTKLKLEKQEKEILESRLKDDAKLYSYLLYGGVCLIIILVFILFFIVAAIRERKLNKRIYEQSLILNNQQLILDEKNEEIAQSIRYALKIQNAMAMPIKEIQKTIGDSFILFKPKEEVSGDFYFTHQIDNEKIVIAVADSKSHGLPGAFMAMLGSSLLREAVVQDKISGPAKILQTVSESIRRSIRLEKDSIFKGIELSVCVLDRGAGEVSYAGGFSSLYIVKNGVLCELKGDRTLVGYSNSGKDNFKKHTESLIEGSCIYLFTDGYVDQFGGNMGKKYKYAQFRNKLCSINKQAMSQQLVSLQKEFDDWKGNHAQVDDVTVIGIRV